MSGDKSDSDTSESSEITVRRRTVAAFIGGAIAGTGTTLGSQRLTNQSRAAAEKPDEKIQTQNRPYLGKQDGTVTVVYYMDFQCPACHEFEGKTLPQINESFSSGDLRLVVKPINAFGIDSKRAALAAHCGWEQLQSPTEYWQWHYNLMSSSSNEKKNSGWATTANLTGFADHFEGIDADEFKACHTEEKHLSRIIDDKEEGQNNGLDGTPYFIIYRDDFSKARTLAGAHSHAKFKNIINYFL
jgi:protein-disulfide isomerase